MTEKAEIAQPAPQEEAKPRTAHGLPKRLPKSHRRETSRICSTNRNEARRKTNAPVGRCSLKTGTSRDYGSRRKDYRRELTYYLTTGITELPLGLTTARHLAQKQFDQKEKRKGRRENRKATIKKAESLFITKAFRFKKSNRGAPASACSTIGQADGAQATGKKINACPGARHRSTYCSPSPRHGRLHSGCWRQKPSARHGRRRSISPYTGSPW